MKRDELIELIDQFVTRQDVSVKQANKIEVIIDDEFPEDDYMQDVVEILALYHPGGGDYLYDEEAVIAKLLQVKKRI